MSGLWGDLETTAFPFNTLVEGVQNVSNFGNVNITSGASSESGITINKPATLNAVGGTAQVGAP